MSDPLAEPITGDGCRAEPMSEAHRKPLRTACAEDRDIWDLWVLDFGPDGFDSSFDRIMSLPWRQFVLFDGDEVAGMSCFINPDAARGRSRSATPITDPGCAAPASIAVPRT